MKISGGSYSKSFHRVFFSSQNQKLTTDTSTAITPAGDEIRGSFIIRVSTQSLQ